MSRPRKYTKEHEAYMVEYYHEVHPDEIAEAIGAPNGRAVIELARRLRNEGLKFMHDGQRPPRPLEPLSIRDGYDTVPWFMRQSTRNQSIPDLQYMN